MMDCSEESDTASQLNWGERQPCGPGSSQRPLCATREQIRDQSEGNECKEEIKKVM